MKETRQTRQTTRAREADFHRIMKELDRLLVLRLEEQLDLSDPDDLNKYNEAKTLRDHIRETLKDAKAINQTRG